MRGSRSALTWGRPMLACVAVVAAVPSFAAEVGQRFRSVEDFVKSTPHASADQQKGYGALTGVGQRDWAGVVFVEDPEAGSTRQLVVLAQQRDGSYEVAAQGPVESTDGGTGHFSLDEVRIKQGSLFVSWSSSWHGCGEGSTQQIKFYKNQWRVVGAEFSQSTSTETSDGYDVGDSATMSHNLLTGAVVIHFKPLHRKAETKTLMRKPTLELLDDKFGSDSGSVEDFAKYAGC